MSGNLEAVKKWVRAFEPSCSGQLSLEDMAEVIVQALAAYDSPQEPEPEPLKLEAGCRVRSHGSHHTGIVLSVYGDFVLWRDCSVLPGPDLMKISHSSNITVVEAATPEMDDYVRIDAGLYEGQTSQIIRKDQGSGEWELRAGKGITLKTRGHFTILHKAPKE